MIVMETVIFTLKPNGHLSIPLMSSKIAAGFPSPAADYIEDIIDLNELLIKNPSSTFLVKVVGDSMIDSFIPPKATLIVDRSLKPKNNNIVVAVVNGEFTVKKLGINGMSMFLYAANKTFKPIAITETMDFLVWGVVSKIIIDPIDIR